MKHTVMLVGPFTDEDLRKIVLVIQEIEGQRPDETFHVLIDDPEGERKAEEFIQEINPLRKGYERQVKYRRR